MTDLDDFKLNSLESRIHVEISTNIILCIFLYVWFHINKWINDLFGL